MEPVGIEPTLPPCKGGVLPLNYGPRSRWSGWRPPGAHRGKYRMTRRENHGRSGGDRTRDRLLPKQARCLCATLRAGRQPDADGPGHDGNLFAWLPHKPSRPQSRQRPEVGRGRCRSGATKKAPGERGPCEKLEVEQLLAIEGVDYATDGQHNHENRRCCHDAHAHASLLTMAIMSPQMIQTPPKINVSALGS